MWNTDRNITFDRNRNTQYKNKNNKNKQVICQQPRFQCLMRQTNQGAIDKW